MLLIVELSYLFLKKSRRTKRQIVTAYTTIRNYVALLIVRNVIIKYVFITRAKYFYASRIR